MSRQVRIATKVAERYVVTATDLIPNAVITYDDLEEFEAKDPKWAHLLRSWKGYRVKMAYEVITEESAAEGDVASQGWEFKNQHEGCLEDAVKALSDHGWLEWSSSGTHAHGDWLVSEEERDMDYGDTTIYHAWIERADHKPLGHDEVAYINKKLGIRH